MTEQERFDRCLGAVLRFEGGYSDDARDRGGPTNVGVTLAALSEALGRQASLAELRALTPHTAAPLYRRYYWAPTRCGQLAPGLDLMVFDAAVNMGPRTAVALLQTALGVAADGVQGAATLAAAAAADPAAAVEAVARLRTLRYRRLEGFAAFGEGWMRRLETMRLQALAWTRQVEATPA